MYRSLQVVWTLATLLVACRPHHTTNPPGAGDSDAVARSVVPVDGGGRSTPRRDALVPDNTEDLVEVIGTAPQLMKLPSVGKLTISDHGQTQLAHGRWKIFGYVSVNDTPEVLAKIRALGMKASVPRSVAERERDMQPAPTRRDAAAAPWGFPQFRGP